MAGDIIGINANGLLYNTYGNGQSAVANTMSQLTSNGNAMGNLSPFGIVNGVESYMVNQGYNLNQEYAVGSGFVAVFSDPTSTGGSIAVGINGSDTVDVRLVSPNGQTLNTTEFQYQNHGGEQYLMQRQSGMAQGQWTGYGVGDPRGNPALIQFDPTTGDQYAYYDSGNGTGEIDVTSGTGAYTVYDDVNIDQATLDAVGCNDGIAPGGQGGFDPGPGGPDPVSTV